jgi:hypothetical protein
MTHSRWWDKETQGWTDQREEGGVLISLDEIWSIEFDATPE